MKSNKIINHYNYVSQLGFRRGLGLERICLAYKPLLKGVATLTVTVNMNEGIIVKGQAMTNLRYADDTFLFVVYLEDLQLIIDMIAEIYKNK